MKLKEDGGLTMLTKEQIEKAKEELLKEIEHHKNLVHYYHPKDGQAGEFHQSKVVALQTALQVITEWEKWGNKNMLDLVKINLAKGKKIAELEAELAHHNQWAKDIAKELTCSDATTYRNDAIEGIRQLKAQLAKYREALSYLLTLCELEDEHGRLAFKGDAIKQAKSA